MNLDLAPTDKFRSLDVDGDGKLGFLEMKDWLSFHLVKTGIKTDDSQVNEKQAKGLRDLKIYALFLRIEEVNVRTSGFVMRKDFVDLLSPHLPSHRFNQTKQLLRKEPKCCFGYGEEYDCDQCGTTIPRAEDRFTCPDNDYDLCVKCRKEAAKVAEVGLASVEKEVAELERKLDTVTRVINVMMKSTAQWETLFTHEGAEELMTKEFIVGRAAKLLKDSQADARMFYDVLCDYLVEHRGMTLPIDKMSMQDIETCMSLVDISRNAVA